MKTLLVILQVLTGLSTLGLLVLTIIKAYHGHSSQRITRWILACAGAFVVLTLIVGSYYTSHNSIISARRCDVGLFCMK